MDSALLGKNGPAYLAASTATDLVATCNEGVWGPPKQATTVYVSHDGGTTFTRSIAPGFGPVAAASPDHHDHRRQRHALAHYG